MSRYLDSYPNLLDQIDSYLNVIFVDLRGLNRYESIYNDLNVEELGPKLTYCYLQSMFILPLIRCVMSFTQNEITYPYKMKS